MFFCGVKNDDNLGFVIQIYNLVRVLNIFDKIILPIELDIGTIYKLFLDSIVKAKEPSSTLF